MLRLSQQETTDAGSWFLGPFVPTPLLFDGFFSVWYEKSGPGSSCTFPAPDLVLAIPPQSSGSF